MNMHEHDTCIRTHIYTCIKKRTTYTQACDEATEAFSRAVLAVETLQDEIIRAKKSEEDAMKQYEESQRVVLRLTDTVNR
jgi:hypothetical protein